MTERTFSTFELRSLHGLVQKLLRDSIDLPGYEAGLYSRRNLESFKDDLEAEIVARMDNRKLGGGSAPNNSSHI